jgi:NAD(P)-dependent dehydrogenase (short-subunit alcohol dehydrogenase family)
MTSTTANSDYERRTMRHPEGYPLDASGRVALVVGGTAGIGLAAAQLLVELGATVFVAGRNSAQGEQSATDIGASFVRVDVADARSVDAAVAEVVERAGRLDMSVNGAATDLNRPAEDLTDEEFLHILDINVGGVFRGCQAAGRVMLAQGGGAIVNIASMSGYIVNYPQTLSAYASSKAAVLHLTRALAVEWGERGVRVNSVSPGYTATAMTARSRAMPERLKEWNAASPLGRIAEPHDIAGAIAYLLSDLSAFTTGTDIVVDGGYRLR